MLCDGEECTQTDSGAKTGVYVRHDAIKRIRVDGNGPKYMDIFNEYISANIPFILSGDACVDSQGKRWKIFDEWLIPSEERKPDRLNIPYLQEVYGEDIIPVARCTEEEYGTHPKIEMKFRDYLSYLEKCESEDECLYLKDYHFMRTHRNGLYETPNYYSSDFLNEYCIDKGIDDYRFVYIGPKGSWTPFHADVLRSFSWSANVCGKKRWILYPPGKEEMLKDKLGNLPYSVALAPYASPAHESYRHRLEVEQDVGEIIFVPSGWHHEVHNLETTLSINHNWFNGANVGRCWRYLQHTLHSVQKEIRDCKDMNGWDEHCQVILKAYAGFNYSDFFTILRHIANKRLSSKDLINNEMYNKDVTSIREVMKQMWSDGHMRMIQNLDVEQWIGNLEQAQHSDNVATTKLNV